MIKIICVGRLKEKYWMLAKDEYLKRISKYSDISIIEVDDYPNDNDNIVLEKEKERLLKVINPRDFIVTLEIEGEQLDSVKFTEKLEKIRLQNSNITFIIGGSLGLAEEIKRMSNYKLSFSKMTFPHQLFRVMLLEQIYRSYRILNNEKYHK